MKGWEGEREEKYEGIEWAGSKRMVGKEERSVKAEQRDSGRERIYWNGKEKTK